MIELTSAPINPGEIVSRVESPSAGAIVLFLGTVRELTGDRRTKSLEYECYREMAEKKLVELEAEARLQWELTKSAVVHRLGHLEIGETSVAVAVSSPHRQAAFEAGQWLIHSIKQVVPIWKQERWADGSTEWIHPGVNT